MRWDSSRPVPWLRLVREWLIYVAIMAVILAIFFRDAGIIGALAGLLISGPLYLAFGYAMAKLGYQRKTLKEMRTPQSSSRRSDADDQPDEQRVRRRPPPTRRTSGGGNRPRSKPRRR